MKCIQLFALIITMAIACLYFCQFPQQPHIEAISFEWHCADKSNNANCLHDTFLMNRIEAREVAKFNIVNNFYEGLYIDLYRVLSCRQSFYAMSDHVDYYRIESDSLVVYASDLIFLPKTDTIVEVRKNEATSFLALVPCPEKDTARKAVYHFTFRADSLGIPVLVKIKYPTW